MTPLILTCLVATSIIALFSFIPKLSFTHWAIRGFDFIKIQLTFLQFISFIISILCVRNFPIFLVPLTILIWAIYSNLKRILKFTSLHYKEVKSAVSPLENYSILTSNVFQENQQKDAFIQTIINFNPDILLTLESDRAWEIAMEVLEKDYPYSIKHALPNYYGMHLYSKLPITQPQVQFLYKDSIPSIRCKIKIKDQEVELFCVHPEPPSPTENTYADDRDAELIRLANQIKNLSKNVIVVGDMNDVAWSRTTDLFKKLSGLKDPRVGRAFYSTFSANLPKPLRFPVDHIFCSANILCKRMRTIRIKGSDHLGMWFQFSLALLSPIAKKEVTLTKEEQKEIQNKMHP